MKDELVFDGQFIQVIRRHFVGPSGHPGIWELVRRKTFGRIVAMAAITEERELILIKIFRIPAKGYVLELPAGLMDREGVSEEALAKRELLEETGYRVAVAELLYAGPFNSGLLADEIAVYLGVHAKKAREPLLEGAEEVEVVKAPLDRLLEYLTSQRIKVDAKIAAVTPFLQKRGYMK